MSAYLSIVKWLWEVPVCICVQRIKPTESLNLSNTGAQLRQQRLHYGIEGCPGTVVHARQQGIRAIMQDPQVKLGRLLDTRKVLENVKRLRRLLRGAVEIGIVEDDVIRRCCERVELEVGDDTKGRAGSAKSPE